MLVTKRDGRKEILDITKIQKMTSDATAGLEGVSQSDLELDAKIKFIDGMHSSDIQDALIKTAVEKIDIDVPNWTFVAARLRLYALYHEVGKVLGNVKGNSYGPLQTTIDYGIAQNRYKKDLCDGFDVEDLSDYIIKKFKKLRLIKSHFFLPLLFVYDKDMHLPVYFLYFPQAL